MDYLLLLIVALFFLYKWLMRPLNRKRRFTDVGFFNNKSMIKSTSGIEYIERMKRIRRIGNIPPVYPNGWFCVAESREIECKEVKLIVAFGEQLTLLRSESGVVHVIDSYCPHLGANLSIGGRVVDDNCVQMCLQCPFHGWVFSGESGKCTRIPYNDGTIPEQAKVAVWPVTERNHHIYIWYHCDGHQPYWEIEEIEEVMNGEWTYHGRTENEIICHIEDLPENGSDVAHLNYLHLEGVTSGNDITKFELGVEEPLIKHVWDGNWQQEPDPNGHIGVMTLNQVMTIGKVQVPLTTSKLKARQIGPGIVYMMFDFGKLGRGVVMHHVIPEEPLFQRARFVMYSTLPRIFAKIFLICEAKHFERDIFIWNNKCYAKPAMLVKNDGPINKHRRWYSQFYTENSPRLCSDGSLSNKPRSILDW